MSEHGFTARLFQMCTVQPGTRAHVAVTKPGRPTYVRISTPFTKPQRNITAVKVEYDNGSASVYYFRNPMHALEWWSALPHPVEPTCNQCGNYLMGSEQQGDTCNACLDRLAFARALGAFDATELVA